MTKNHYKIIAFMSGTSLDGMDLVYAEFETESWKYEIKASTTISYDKHWQKRLTGCVDYDADQLKTLDIEYTDLLADTILKFIKSHHLEQIDAVCSHGHTALHQPENGMTYQIGNRAELAKKIGYTVVCDFRMQDVNLGGQGAPLVPIGDRMLFWEYDACLNLGGFANISYEEGNQRIAFDICPVNIVMNHYCKQIGLNYDDKGNLASEGTIDTMLLTDLNALEFYRCSPPKSLGLEWVNANVFPLIDSYELSVKDILRTFVEHVSVQIGNVTDRNGRILITGGGVYNDFLVSRVKEHSRSEVVIPSKEIIEYKEALIFGLLGILKLRNEVNVLKSITGAEKDHSAGNIFTP